MQDFKKWAKAAAVPTHMLARAERLSTECRLLLNKKRGL